LVLSAAAHIVSDRGNSGILCPVARSPKGGGVWSFGTRMRYERRKFGKWRKESFLLESENPIRLGRDADKRKKDKEKRHGFRVVDPGGGQISVVGDPERKSGGWGVHLDRNANKRVRGAREGT